MKFQEKVSEFVSMYSDYTVHVHVVHLRNKQVRMEYLGLV